MRKRASDEGFTLIELLVVMIIIGILAAIAVPVFLSQRAKARDTATKADLAAVGKAVLSYYVDGGTAPAVVISGGKTWSVGGNTASAVSDGVRIVTTYTGTPVNTDTPTSVTTTGWSATGWCFALTNDGGDKKTFRYSNAQGLEQGQCASATSPV